MPRPRRPWFRFYTEAMHDPKIRRLTPEQRWLWVAVLAAARQSCEPGRLLIGDGMPMLDDEVAELAGMKVRDVVVGLARMAALGMVERDGTTWTVPRWSERQYESDTSAERTAKWRHSDGDSDVTTTSRVTPPETETDTEPERAARKRATPPPMDFVMDPELRVWAAKNAPGVDLERECQRWLVWCVAEGKTYKDHRAGFMTWLGRAKPTVPLPVTNGNGTGERYIGPSMPAICPDCKALSIDCVCGAEIHTFGRTA